MIYINYNKKTIIMNINFGKGKSYGDILENFQVLI